MLPASVLRPCGLLVALLVLAPASSADTLKVPGDFETIQDAVDAASDGDTIVVSLPVTGENVIVDGASGLTLRAKGKVTVDGGASGPAFVLSGCTDVEVRGFRIVNTGTDGVRVAGSSGTRLRQLQIEGVAANGVYVLNSDGTRVEKCTIVNAGQDGVLAEESDGVRIEKCKIEDAGDNGVTLGDVESDCNQGLVSKCKIADADNDGISVTGDENLVEKNVITTPGDDGIDFGDDDSSALNRVEKNTVKSPDDNGIILRGTLAYCAKNKVDNAGTEAFDVQGTGNHTLEKNKSVHAGSVGVVVRLGSNENVFVKNTILMSDEDGIAVEATHNVFEKDKVLKSGQRGLRVTGDENSFTKLKVKKSGTYDLSDAGTGNTYEGTTFATEDPAP